MKFWDLETFELIGSTRPEVYSGVPRFQYLIQEIILSSIKNYDKFTT